MAEILTNRDCRDDQPLPKATARQRWRGDFGAIPLDTLQFTAGSFSIGKIVAFSIRYFTQIRKNHTYFRIGGDFLVFPSHIKQGKIPTPVSPRHDQVTE
jgi:hypothetical protein